MSLDPNGGAPPREIRAAVVRERGGPFRIEALQLEAPRDEEVLVRVVAVGMCHTDMVARDQQYPVPHPIVLGHEGAGVVEAVGRAVTKVAPGDHVVLTFHSCGRCGPCLRGRTTYCERFFPLNFAGTRLDGSTAARDGDAPVHAHFFGQSSFGSYALAHERNTVKVPRDAPLELLGPLGCGFQTGAGAVLNALRVGAGDTFAVFGTGAVGLSAVMAAHAVAAGTVIAVDVVPSRLELARELGATHVVNGRATDAVAAIRAATGGRGVDYALEATGVPAVLRQAIDALAPLGTCGIVGAAPSGAEAKFDINDVMVPGKTIRGVIEGDSVPDEFIPRLVELHRAGRFPIERLVRFYPFDEIDAAAQDSEQGGTIKPILRLG